MSIRLKIVAIVFSLLAVMGAAFVLYSISTTDNYRRLRVEGLGRRVEFESEKVNKAIRELERNAIDLANGGRTLYFSADHSDVHGTNIVVENFESFPASVGGGLWFEPYMYQSDVRRACYYALRDRETGKVRIDPEFRSIHYNFHTQSWYLEIQAAAKKRHVTAWTRPYYDDTGSEAFMTTVGAMIYDWGGSFVGMSTVDWEIESVVAGLTAIRPTPNSFVLLAVPDDDFVMSNTYDQQSHGAGASLGSLPWYDDIVRPEAGELSVGGFSFEGVEYMSFARSMDNGWLLAVNIPRSEIFSEIEVRNERFSRLLPLAALVMLATAWWLVSALVNKPIRRLIGDVEKLGGGDLDVKIDVRSEDEIGKLGSAFNKMTGDLRASLDKEARERSERDRIAGELEVATRIQVSMLPCTFPAFPERSEFDIYATMMPAREVGGDFYDFFLVDDKHLAVVMADVSGKGIPAALFMVIARTLVKNNAQSGKSPGEVLAAVNNLLCENNEAGMFVTAFVGYLEVATGAFTYSNAGHNPPLFRRAGGKHQVLCARPGLALAVLEDVDYIEDSIAFGAGDMLLLYTDGVTEAENSRDELYGLDRFRASADAAGDLPLRDALAATKRDIDAFADGAEQADDITMLVLRMGDPAVALRDMATDALVSNLYAVQGFIEGVLRGKGCPEAVLSQIALATEEAFVNIAGYAYPKGTGKATVFAGIEGGSAVIVFEDAGVAFNPLDRPEPDIDAPADARPIGGLGIFMMRKIMDSVEYRREDGKNILTLRKRLDAGGRDTTETSFP